MIETKPIAAQYLHDFVLGVHAALNDGWKIDDHNPPIQLGLIYSCFVVKETEDPTPPMSRAEILAKARAAKAAKAASGESTDAEDAQEGPQEAAGASEAPQPE